MSKNNPNNYVKFPMNFPAGLGYSPAGGPPVGGWSLTPGPGFYGKQPMDSLLPRLSGPGSTPRSSTHFFGRKKSRSFGYPLMNRPSQEINERDFPRYPVGNGSSPGGDGGVWLQGMPGFQSYWGFGVKRRKSRKSRRVKKSRKSRKSTKSRKSRKYDPTEHLKNSIKTKNRKQLIIALDNFDHSKGWNGPKYYLYRKGLKILNNK